MTTIPSATSGAAAQTAANGAKLTADFNAFLKMLTTQLQYQDPTAPMDTDKFTQQLVSFSQVEQSIQQTQRLDSMLARMNAQDVAQASGFVGRTIEIGSNRSALVGGAANWSYTLPVPADSVALRVTDEKGLLVREIDGATEAGDHRLVWDGKNASGTEMPEGVYKLEVVAKSAAGAAIDASANGRGRVDAVTIDKGQIMLQIGKLAVKPSDLVAIA